MIVRGSVFHERWHQVGFSATMRKINSRNSLLILFRPSIFRWREIQFQYKRNPARCQRATVSGVTITRACFHSDHKRRAITQKSLCGQPTLGRESRRLKTINCWRRAMFSNNKSRRDEKRRRNNPIRSLSRRSMANLYISNVDSLGLR